MPELNIEEKIQEALKRKSFKENKLEYLGLSLIFCLMLFVTFVVAYFIPLLAILIFIFVDIPFIMGFKHFIWFGPASGETLIDGFKLSMICGYLNFASYVKIFFTTNAKAILFAFIAFFATNLVGGVVMDFALGGEVEALMNSLGDNPTSVDLINSMLKNEAIMKGIMICQGIALVVSLLTFYIVKLSRAILPYISFLRLTNLEGKSMEGVLTHTKKVLDTRRWAYYLKSTLVHLWYLLPVGLTVLTYVLLSLNPVYSPTTLDLISSLVFFVSMFPAVLFIELNYRDFCIDVNQEYLKEHKKMLNDAINDLNKNK